MNAREYMKGRRFSTYELGYAVQLRDNRPTKFQGCPTMGIVAVFPTTGGGYTTAQGYPQAVRLARKICRTLNQ